jgi:hypothetical protein
MRGTLLVLLLLAVVGAEGVSDQRNGRDNRITIRAQHEVLARNELGEACRAAPALSGRLLIFRTEKYVGAAGPAR